MKSNLITKEKIIVGLIIFLAIFFAKFPTIYNSLNTPKGYWYPKQTSWFDAWDINFQVSYIRYGERHGLNLVNTYTTLPHQGVFIYQYYTFLGVVNRLLHLDPFLLFHLSSVITSIIFLLVLYYVVGIFFQNYFLRLSAYTVITLGGGLGWVRLLNPAADANLAGFTSLYALERGHEAFIALLLLLCFVFILRFLQTHKNKYLFWSIIAGFISFTIHPPFALLILIIGMITGMWEYLRSKNNKLLLFPIILGILYVIYFILVYYQLLVNPGFSGVLGQNLFTVDSLYLAFGWGIMGIFIAWMLIFDKDYSQEIIFLKLLFLIQMFLLLSPLGFHLYYAKNLFTWGVLLALFGIKNMIKQEKFQIRTVLFIVALSLFTRLYIFNVLMHPDKNNPFFFLALPEGKALEAMAKLPPDTGVLSLYRIGNYIPAFSDTRVFYGHNFQTPNSSEKRLLAQKFYTQMEEKERRAFLTQNHIDYVYYGPEEISLRKNQKLATENPFSEYPIIYQNEKVIIYAASNYQKK